jgi:galactofuranose transport system permease protein
MTTQLQRQPQDYRRSVVGLITSQGALLALLLLVVFGALRYDGFLSAYNLTELLRYNAMFGLLALGMTFVIMTGGIDLSVGAVAVLCSVVAALLSPFGPLAALLLTVLVGTLIGIFNGYTIAWLGIAPFITTLATLLGARGAALLLANNAAVSVDTSAGFANIGLQGLFGLPFPVLILFVGFIVGWVVQEYTRFGRHVLAVGGNEDAASLMGLPVKRIKLGVYALSGGLAGLTGVLLASLTFTGLPTEGVGWELQAIAAVVVGGTLLTGGKGSVAHTLVGALLLGLVFNILNFENGRGSISLSAYWQSVIRGGFLLLVVVLQRPLKNDK